MDMMELYVCPDCKLLLLRVDKKYAQWEEASLTIKGVFVGTYNGDFNDDVKLESFHCHLCGCNTEHPEPAERLRSVQIPESCIEGLLKISSKLTKQAIEDKDDELTEKLDYGIPADNQELKELITISLL